MLLSEGAGTSPAPGSIWTHETRPNADPGSKRRSVRIEA